MRPERAVVKKAIEDGKGNLTKTASLLGCTRQTLYTWIYMLGLDKAAGIRMDKRDELDRRERKDTSAKNHLNRVSNPPAGSGAKLSLVAAQATIDQKIPATVKLPESLWKRIRTKAIWEGVTVSVFVEKLLSESMAVEEQIGRKGRKGGNGDGQ
jgi:hypothetical protein